MAVRPPGQDDLAAIARGYGMHLSDEDLGLFEPMVAGLLSSYDAVEELYAQTAPQPPANRTWKQPDPAGNPLGAWYVRTEMPAASDPREVQIGRALGTIRNTAPFDISGHPAISVPAGLADGLPVGMMIVGKRFDAAACLRVAHAFERLTGGFPAPPGAA
jgi:Asp-tRNA(Asn)/Glu-tRNA(Gln) amidotransferase A subunit family amidase